MMLPTEALADDSHARELAKRLRRILPLVFGSLLALMIIAAIVSLYSLRQLDDIARQAQQRFAAHTQAISSIVVLVDVYDNQMDRYLFQRKNAALTATAGRRHYPRHCRSQCRPQLSRGHGSQRKIVAQPD